MSPAPCSATSCPTSIPTTPASDCGAMSRVTQARAGARAADPKIKDLGTALEICNLQSSIYNGEASSAISQESHPMPSPFPGMDPYLEDEALWPNFHHQMVMCLYQILLPGLVDRYRARVAQRHYVTEQALFTSVLRQE